MDFPSSHWRKIRTDNARERANREIKRRAKVVQSFPSRGSLVRLVGAVPIGEEDVLLASGDISRSTVGLN